MLHYYVTNRKMEVKRVRQMKNTNLKHPRQTKRVCRSGKIQIQLWKRYGRTGRNKECKGKEIKNRQTKAFLQLCKK